MVIKNNNDIRITLSDPETIEMDFDDRVTIKYVESDHRLLDNLDYEHSGHTGFMPLKLSILPKIAPDTPNERLMLLASDGENTGTVVINEIRDRIIKTVNSGSILADAQIGQYIFIEK